MNRQAVNVDLYTRRDGIVRGPYTTGQVTRYILLGRIRLEDELSSDRMKWAPAVEFATLLPPEINSLDSWSDYQRLIEARLQVDERHGERRCNNCPGRGKCAGERRSGAERRFRNEVLPVKFPASRSLQDRFSSADRPALLRALMFGLLLASLIFAWLVPTGR